MRCGGDEILPSLDRIFERFDPVEVLARIRSKRPNVGEEPPAVPGKDELRQTLGERLLFIFSARTFQFVEAIPLWDAGKDCREGHRVPRKLNGGLVWAVINNNVRSILGASA